MVLTGGSGEHSSRSDFAVTSFLAGAKIKAEMWKRFVEIIFKDWIFGGGGIFLLKPRFNFCFRIIHASKCFWKVLQVLLWKVLEVVLWKTVLSNAQSTTHHSSLTVFAQTSLHDTAVAQMPFSVAMGSASEH